MPLTSGTKIGPYEIASLLGVGGMGEVYRSRDSKTGREVALKVLPSSVVVDADRLARFFRTPDASRLFLQDLKLITEPVSSRPQQPIHRHGAPCSIEHFSIRNRWRNKSAPDGR